jgi:hypothetical protein
MIQQLNPPIEGLDTPIYRETYRDLKRGGHLKGVGYYGFLETMRNRNLAIRKKEFNERSLTVDSLSDFLKTKETRKCQKKQS